MSLPFIRFVAAALLLAASAGSAVAQQTCADLMDLELPYTTITSAATAAAGAIPQPAIFGNTEPVIAPERCEVQAVTRPTKDSEIRIELWLPLSGWNGKYLQIGNGGWAGSINRTRLIGPLQRGYAVAATDNGHVSEGLVPGATWAIGHPEKLIDFGYRAVHETRVQENVRTFLDRFPDARSENTDIGDFYRLFLVPGLGHCSGGIGPSSFGNGFLSARTDAEHDLLSALEAWVEQDTAPEKLIGTGTAASDPTATLTRPLCPYPQTARYVGRGNPNDAANFECALPAGAQ